MNRKLSFLSCVMAFACVVSAQTVTPTKNVILMIPDGTSLSVLSASRWLQTYRRQGSRLCVDPYLCGTVTTFSSNAPIGDSAPTTSCYMTGMAQQPGNVAIYPLADPGNDLIRVNPDSAYQPLATILEAMKIEQKKAAGLVVTCEFPHATPADCSAHTYNRSDYKTIGSQMAANNLDVMFGGGNDYLTDDMKRYLGSKGTVLIQNDKDALLRFQGDKVWALYGKKELPYDLDRDTTAIPSLAQMTSKAIDVLAKNQNGFFLMVEGSKVDWAAHANDPIAIMTEFLAFDKAVGVAIEYAKRVGNTTVVILPDHGNSGFSIGRNNMKKNYTRMSLTDLFDSVSHYQHTAEGMEKILLNSKPEEIKRVFLANTGIELTDAELKQLLGSKNYKSENYMEVSHSQNMTHYITNIMNAHSTFGFTSGGHTGEEVFLAVYHPEKERPEGNLRNRDIHHYLYQVAGLKQPLQELTAAIYAKHTQVFAGMNYIIEAAPDALPVLVVKNKKNTLRIKANTSTATLNDKAFDLGSVAVYVDKNNTFYLPGMLADKLK